MSVWWHNKTFPTKWVCTAQNESMWPSKLVWFVVHPHWCVFIPTQDSEFTKNDLGGAAMVTNKVLQMSCKTVDWRGVDGYPSTFISLDNNGDDYFLVSVCDCNFIKLTERDNQFYKVCWGVDGSKKWTMQLFPCAYVTSDVSNPMYCILSV